MANKLGKVKVDEKKEILTIKGRKKWMKLSR